MTAKIGNNGVSLKFATEQSDGLISVYVFIFR